MKKPSQEQILQNVIHSFEIENIYINPEQAKAISQKVMLQLNKRPKN